MSTAKAVLIFYKCAIAFALMHSIALRILAHIERFVRKKSNLIIAVCYYFANNNFIISFFEILLIFMFSGTKKSLSVFVFTNILS